MDNSHRIEWKESLYVLPKSYWDLEPLTGQKSVEVVRMVVGRFVGQL